MKKQIFAIITVLSGWFFLFAVILLGNPQYRTECLWGEDNKQYCEYSIRVEWGKLSEYDPILQNYYPPSSFGNFSISWGACIYSGLENWGMPDAILCNAGLRISGNFWFDVGGENTREFYTSPLLIYYGDGAKVREEQ